ncbi:MFS transporter [Caenimonas aquaedulcis]|uniref:MFS transporter n=1 Tax=Caenimonas aquaedulcis TaxID=2793270 RepID=A0A931H6S2_9BURK|nr:MFS transporter [Caenimonas aquaedulcis]MBG9389578.1 MFS transporter [Caenimonas aquaedulcis]
MTSAVRDVPIGWRYGLLGLPLAFVALPLYVQLPSLYAREFGVPLGALGALLLLARLADAAFDPWVGIFVDRLFRRSPREVLAAGAAASAALALGFALLMLPPVRGTTPLLAWAALSLLVTYAAFSVLSVAHQSWGAMLGGDEAARGRIVASREGMGLIGVLLASALPAFAGLPATACVLAAGLAAGWWAWAASRRPVARVEAPMAADWFAPLRVRGFRRLLSIFMLNGIASAIPATLVLFFVRDRLQAPPAQEPLFLASYFLCAALSIPLWLKVVTRIGLARTWLAGMAVSIGVFVWAAALGAGDSAAFLVVCALSGVALGTDLALPSALLAGVIGEAGQRGRGEGQYFGWWNFATKMNLALAAGVALPSLAFAGYTPGSRSPQALDALALAYCVLPCVLKLAAATLLHFHWIRPGAAS